MYLHQTINRLRAAVGMAALLGCSVSLANATTYYVSTSGNDSNPGTQAAPFRHVSKGAAAAHAGDTVIVMDGTYDNEGQVANLNTLGAVVTMTNSGSPGNPITIEAQDRGQAILDASSATQSSLGCYGAWSYFDLSYTSYVVIQGFQIKNGCVNGIRANGNAHDLTLRWNQIYDIGNWNNPAATLSPSGMYVNNTEYNIVIDGNTFHDIGGGTNVNQQHAVYSSANSVTIVNNIFYNQVHGWDIQLAGGQNVVIANNTFAFPNPSRQGQIVLWDDGNAGSLQNIVIENNIFYQPQTYGIVTALSGGSIGGCQISYNITTTATVYDNGSSCSQTDNLINADPNLTNASSAPYDFHLAAGSRAIDSGVNNNFTTVDNENWPRPVNVIYDRGAYEYHAVPAASISLSANPGSVSFKQGASGSVSIVATVTGSASPQFSAAGLPSGVTASFLPSSCSGSCTATLTLNASASYQGSATVTVTASSAGVSGSTKVALSVTPPGTTTTTTSSSAGDYTSNLRAEWKLLDNTNDNVGGDNGTLHSGFAWATGAFAGGNLPYLSLNGTSGYVSVAEKPQLEMSSQLTVAFWVYSKPSPNNDSGQRLVAKVYDWDIKLNGNHPQFTEGNFYAMANYSLPYNAWVHVAFTFFYGAVHAFINGQEVALAASNFPASSRLLLATTPSGLYLGTDSSLADFFAGGLSDVRIYNRELVARDISALYAAGASAIK